MTYHSMGATSSLNVKPPVSAMPACAPSAVLQQAAVECQRRRDAGLASWGTPAAYIPPTSVRATTSASTSTPTATTPAPTTFDWSRANPCEVVKLSPCGSQAAQPSYMVPPTSPPSVSVLPPTPLPPVNPPDTTSTPDTTTEDGKAEPNYLLYGAIGVGALAVVGFVIYEVTR